MFPTDTFIVKLTCLTMQWVESDYKDEYQTNFLLLLIANL